ncbi:hypothetical protein U1Q18_015084 [Sarracenia purpurea var. burkii]
MATSTSSSTEFFGLREGDQNQMKHQHSSVATWSTMAPQDGFTVDSRVDSNVSLHRETEEDIVVVDGCQRSGAGSRRWLLKTMRWCVGTLVVKVGRLAEEGSEVPKIH